MLGEEFRHLGLDRLGQQGARSVAQHLGERVGKRPWLKQLDDVSIGHGVSLLCWRSGGSNTPTIRRLLPVRPSPTSAYSSERRDKGFTSHWWVELVSTLDKLTQWSHHPDGFHAIVCYALGEAPEIQKLSDGSTAQLVKKDSPGRYTLLVGSDTLEVYVLREI